MSECTERGRKRKNRRDFLAFEATMITAKQDELLSLTLKILKGEGIA
mgnify:CR=1 FL=1